MQTIDLAGRCRPTFVIRMTFGTRYKAVSDCTNVCTNTGLTMKATWCLAIAVLVGMSLSGCDDDTNPLSPYAGERELIVQRITSSATPDFQWVGGRVGAVGVNRGPLAALDTTLVWIKTAADNSISSALSIGQDMDRDVVLQFGGTPLDSLEDATEYTFWLAEKAVFDGGLTPSQLDGFNFSDTTLTLRYKLLGRSGGGPGFIETISIVRDQRLTGDSYLVMWAPSSAGVRRLAIRQGSSGGFTDLVWDLIAEESNTEGIMSPLTIGQPPPGVVVGAEWPDDGFEAATYTLWMVNQSWTGSFSPRASGYAFLQIFSSNFE